MQLLVCMFADLTAHVWGHSIELYVSVMFLQFILYLSTRPTRTGSSGPRLFEMPRHKTTTVNWIDRTPEPKTHQFTIIVCLFAGMLVQLMCGWLTLSPSYLCVELRCVENVHHSLGQESVQCYHFSLKYTNQVEWTIDKATSSAKTMKHIHWQLIKLSELLAEEKLNREAIKGQAACQM